MKNKVSILILLLILSSFCYFHVKEVRAGEQIINGDFETGDFTGWDWLSDWGDEEVQTEEKHSGTYALIIPTIATMYQNLTTPMPVSNITSFTLWYKKESYATGSTKVTYTDDSDSSFIDFTVNDAWTEVDILPSLDSAKTVRTLWIVKGYSQITNNDFWLDDVSLDGEIWQYYFNFDFLDFDSEDVELYVDWALWNSTHDIEYTEGAVSLSGTYYLKTSKYGRVINTTTLDTATYGNSTVDINLNMKRHQSCSNGFIVSNDTISSITTHEETPQLLNFTIDGSTPAQMGIGVPKNASYIWKYGFSEMAGWCYRKSHVINAQNGAGTNYQKKIVCHYDDGSDSGEDVYLNWHCRIDFGDIRFTKADETTELDYWIQSKTDADKATLWVKIADDLNSSDVTIYIYYGKADATTTSNMTNTFPFFCDDFEDGIRDEIWDVFKTGTGVISETSGQLRYSSYDVAAGGGYVSHASKTFSNSEICVKVRNLQLHSIALIISLSHSTVNHPEAYYDCYDIALKNYDDTCYVKRRLGGATITLYSDSWITEESYIKIRIDDSTIYFLEDDTERHSEAYALATRNVYFYLVAQTTTGYTGADWFDNFFIRKYVNPEPTHGSWGFEENGKNVTGWVYTQSPSHIYFNQSSFSTFSFHFPSTTGPVVGPHGIIKHRLCINVRLNGEWLKGCHVTVEGGPDNRLEWGFTDVFGRSKFRVKTGHYEIVANYEDYWKKKPIYISTHMTIGIDLTESDFFPDGLPEDREILGWVPLPELDFTSEVILVMVLPLLVLLIYGLKKALEGPKRKWRYSYLR